MFPRPALRVAALGRVEIVSFKDDRTFVKYLTAGAAATRAIADDMAGRLGHSPVDLERQTMTNKLWATKIKRLRVPDLICASCGTRVEARGKSRLLVAASDSNKPGREWHAGLHDSDVIAIVKSNASGDKAVVGRSVAYFRVADLAVARPQAVTSRPKRGGKGNEVFLTWPSLVADVSGEVVAAGTDEVVIARGDRSTATAASPEGEGWRCSVESGQDVFAGETILFCVAPGGASFPCPGQVWNPVDALTAADAPSRYAAVRVLRTMGGDSCEDDLRLVAETDPDERLRLEAVGTLAALGGSGAVGQLSQRAGAGGELAMESVFILSELSAVEAVEALVGIARERSLGDELRSAAAWGLAGPAQRAFGAFAEFVGDATDEVALHAIARSGPLSQIAMRLLLVALASGSTRTRVGAARVLVQAGLAARFAGDGSPAWSNTADVSERLGALHTQAVDLSVQSIDIDPPTAPICPYCGDGLAPFAIPTGGGERAIHWFCEACPTSADTELPRVTCGLCSSEMKGRRGERGRFASHAFWRCECGTPLAASELMKSKQSVEHAISVIQAEAASAPVRDQTEGDE